MFKSKGFTAAFIILSLLIIALGGVFIYLLVGGEGEQIIENVIVGPSDEAPTLPPSEPQDTTPEEAESGEAEETAAEDDSLEAQPSEEAAVSDIPADTPGDYQLRARLMSEPHNLPLIDELITEDGYITIVKDGDAGEGITFRQDPAVGTATKMGDVVNHSGSFDISQKLYILYNGQPFLLYKTADNYYVTSSRTYVSFTARTPHIVSEDPDRIGTYGEAEGSGLCLKVHQDDGQTMAFSLYNADGSDFLVNVIGTYNSEGRAKFEFHNSDGNFADGTLSFSEPDNGKRTAVISFSAPVAADGTEKKDFVFMK